MYRLEREKCAKVRVRDSEDEPWRERILTDYYADGSCQCVTDLTEQSFKEGYNYSTVTWKYYEEITEPIYRPYQEGDDITQLLGRVIVKKQAKNTRSLITGVTDDKEHQFVEVNANWYSMGELHELFAHEDNSPIGVKI